MKKWLRILCAVCAVSVLLCMGVLPGSAASGTTITIDNTGGDVNPFIRLFPNNKICGSGGPFTFSFDLKIENYRRMSGQNGSVFVHLQHADTNNVNTSIAYWQGNTLDESGNPAWVHFDYNFSDIKVTLIDGEFRPYALINIGLYYVKAKVSIKNFQITNAAGTVVYSFDTDPDLNGLDDLRNIADRNPEPMLVATSFGESGNASYPISADGGSDTTTTTKKPQYEDDTTTTQAPDNTTVSSEPDGTTTSSNADGSTTSSKATTATTKSGVATTTKNGTTQPASNGAEESGGFPVWAIVLIVVAVLAAGGVAAFVLIRRRQATK